MPLLLIGVRQNRWHKDPALALLNNGDVPADPLADLRVSGNQLSVWEILPDRSNLMRIVRALAVGKDKLEPSGWLLFSSELLMLANIKPPDMTKQGTTKDAAINRFHGNLVNLTGNRLVILTAALLTFGETGQFLKKELLEYVESGITLQELKEEDLPEGIREQLVKYRSLGQTGTP